MASIYERGPFQFQAVVRIKGARKQVQTFETRTAAELWAAGVEADIRRGLFVDMREAQKTNFGEALSRYESDVLPSKAGGEAELPRIRYLREHYLAEKSLADLGPADFARYRDERLNEVSAGTVLRELSVISAVFSCVIKDWGYPIDNPISRIRKPKQPEHRERRLEAWEETRLFESVLSGLCRAPQLSDAIELALETGMRAGEIVGLRRDNIHLRHRHLVLDKTKNGSKRIVPLTERAEEILKRMLDETESERLFSFHDTRGLSAAFRRACKRAGIEGLTFHDLRHEAASRMAKRIPSPSTLAKIMGWRTLQMAMRYYNPTPDDLVDAVRAA